MSTLMSRILGLAASLALILLVAGIPALLVGLGAIPSAGDFSLGRLTGPDDGSLAVAVIGVVAWLAWLVFTASAAVELAARLRGIHAPRLPGLALPQMSAARLIALASLLFVAAPTAAQTFPGPPAVAAPTTAVSPQTAPHPHRAVATLAAIPEAVQSHAHKHATPTVSYTVKRGDSLWKIAQQRLGDGRRYNELVALNEAMLHGRPDFITPGTVLQVPDDTPPSREDTYVVEPGDTLSEIAADRLGDPTAYPRIFRASRDTVQPDGEHLTDADLIRPGWKLTIPGSDDRPEAESQHRSQQSDTPPTAPHAPATRREPTVADDPTVPRIGTTRSAPAATNRGNQVDAADTREWVLPGLVGAGALLAGSLLMVLRQHRSTQQRYRRPGRVIAPPPPELRPAEKSAHLSGTTTAPKIEVLDRALRHLAVTSAELPRLRSIELAADDVTVHLAEPAELPEPWRGGQTTWCAALASDFSDTSGAVAPYPLLVSIGQTDAGALALVNLEELRSIAVTGDPDRTTALGRHLAAELSLNPWSVLVEIDTLGIGYELATIDPLRLHHHGDGDTAFLDRLASDLEAESAEEPERFRALVTTEQPADDEAVHKIAKILTTIPGRSGAAVVTINGDPSPDDIQIHVTSTGRLSVDDLDLDLAGAGLTAEEAAACAAIVDLTRDVDDAPTPVAPDTGDEEPLVDEAGTLRLEVTERRPEGFAGDRSLLPQDGATYERVAATTTDDLDRLAPVVPQSVSQTISNEDPQLDSDLAIWTDPASRVPRLTLLGSVNARTSGEATAVARRKPFYVELLAYLALHPKGVTTAQVCDAFRLREERARTDLSAVRRWLGTDLRTGELYLPSARTRQQYGHRGAAVYQVKGVATDMDLFRRLRTRGQSRGVDGIADLVTALALVSGEPFADLRPAGWSWLLDGDRMDHIMTCAIVDVAHIVTTHALTAGDYDLARLAAETAYRAAPDDETSRLDLIAVAAATGHADLAEQQLVHEVLNRSDDGLGPVSLPARSARIINQRGWDQPPKGSSP
jgi:nucleoid-associated protein YgaU